MPRPIVEIHQELLNAVIVPADPTQKSVIVGPAYVLRRYPEDKGASADHVYSPFDLIAVTDNGLAGDSGDAVKESIPEYPGMPVPALTPDLSGQYAPKVYAESVYYFHEEVSGCALTDLHPSAAAGRTIVTRADGDWTTLSDLADASTPMLRARVLAPSHLQSVLEVAAGEGVNFLTAGVTPGHVVRCKLVVNAQAAEDSQGYANETVDLKILRVEANRLYLADTPHAPYLQTPFQVAVAAAEDAVLDDEGADAGAQAVVDAVGEDHEPSQAAAVAAAALDGATAASVAAAVRAAGTVTPTDGPLNGTGLDATVDPTTGPATASEALKGLSFHIVLAGAQNEAASVVDGTVTGTGGEGQPAVTNFSLRSMASLKSQVGGVLSNGLSAAGDSPTLNLSIGINNHFRTTSLHKATVRLEALWQDGPITLTSGTHYAAKAAEVTLGENAQGAASPMQTSEGATILSANIYVQWRALNTNLLPEIGSLSATSQIEPTLGLVDPKNPLALAMQVALSNSGGVSVSYLPIFSDDAVGFTNALNTLNSDPNVYAMVPLSSDLAGVLLPYRNAATAMSAPKKGKFRIAIGSTAEVPLFKYTAHSPSLPGDQGQAVGQVFIDADEDVNFIQGGVAAGDEVVNSDTDDVIGTVVSVEGESALELSGVQGDVFGVNYYIRRNITAAPALRAQALVDILAGSNDKRLIMTYPAVCSVLAFPDALPGYYLSAALGGMMAVLPPHRPLNQIGIAAITGIQDSNFTFNEEQIDVISDGGYFVFVQDNPAGAPFCVHQLTSAAATMPGVQEFTEVSVVRNFDFVSSFFKKRLDPYVGVWNVIPSAFSSIRSTLDAGIIDLTGRTSSIIGAPLLSGKVDFIRQSEADAGTLEGSVTVRLPKVLNRLVIHLVSA